MSNFKVGDKVVVNGYGYVDRVGFVTWAGVSGVMVDSGLTLGEHKLSADESEFHLYFTYGQVFQYTPHSTLQVGKTYTSENGSEWECIFTRGDNAWMVGVYSGWAEGSAYAFDIDGTASWASCAGDGYNIKWGPKRETVTKRASVSINRQPMDSAHYTFNITFDIIDGTPDWTTAKVTPCD